VIQRKEYIDWKGVFTNADTAKLVDGMVEELKNFRPVNGQLEKTFGFGEVAGINAVTLGGGTVINVIVYNHTEFTNEYAYIAVIRASDTSIDVKYWDGSAWTSLLGSETPSAYRTSARDPIVIADKVLRVLASEGEVPSGAVSSLSITDGGSNYLDGSLVFSGGGGSGASGTFTVSGGVIDTLTLTDGGTGYTSAPTVTPDPLKSLNWALTTEGTDDQGDTYAKVINVGNYYIVSNLAKLLSYTWDGTTLTYIDSVTTANVAHDLTTDDTYIYTVTDTGKVEAYSLNQSTGAMALITTRTGAGSKGILAYGGYIYFASTSTVYSVTFDGSSFSDVDNESLGGTASEITGLWHDGTYLHVLGRGGTLGIMAFLTTSGSFGTVINNIVPTGDVGYDIGGDGTNLYVADEANGVEAFSFDGSNYSTVGSIDDGGNYKGVHCYGSRIYCSSSAGMFTYVINSGTFSESQSSQNTDINGIGCFADSNGVLNARSGAGLSAYSFTNTDTAILVANVNASNESTGLWIGYIDRDFYDELYSPTAGFYAYDKTPLTPDSYENTSGVDVDLSLNGWGDSASNTTKRYVRYAWVYDGNQESMLSGLIYTTIDDDIDKAYFRLKLYDGTATNTRSNYRITGVRVYEMDSASKTATATLINEYSFTQKAANKENFSSAGKAKDAFWINDDAIGSKTSGSYSADQVGATVRIKNYVSGDDFTNIGAASNATGVEFVISGSTPTTWTNGSELVFLPQVGDWVDTGYDTAADYEQITAVEELTDGTWVLTTAGITWVEYTVTSGDWDLSQSDADNSKYASGSGSGYYGENVIIDGTVDFNDQNSIGLTVASCKTDGTAAHTGGSAAGDNDLLTVLEVNKHCVLVDSDSNAQTTFRYNIAAQPYVFYLNNSDYHLYAILDFGNKEGSSYGLQDVVSIKVNSDYAKVIGGRMFLGNCVLDPGGENEEQGSSICYSELDQYDVVPVSNRIPINDRESSGVTGIEELFGNVVVALGQSLQIINIKADPNTPANWIKTESPHNIGNIAKQGMISVLGKVYVCYHDGIYALSANNLADTDSTPTEKLKITNPIEDTYQALTTTQKEAIEAEYDQLNSEIVFNLNSEFWAYSVITGFWREITTGETVSMMIVDEDADILVFNNSDQKFYNTKVSESVAPGVKVKREHVSYDRKELIRSITVNNPYTDQLTVTPYVDGVAKTATNVSGSTAKAVVPVNNWGYDFQFKLEWAASTNDVKVKRVVAEYDLEN